MLTLDRMEFRYQLASTLCHDIEGTSQESKCMSVGRQVVNRWLALFFPLICFQYSLLGFDLYTHSSDIQIQNAIMT